MHALKLMAYLTLALGATSVFAETNLTDASIRNKMARQISNWSASHGGAVITYEHIVTGYGTTLDATMRFTTADGQLQCEKVGFNIAVCRDQNGDTVTLPNTKHSARRRAETVDTRKFYLSEADGCPPQITASGIDVISHHCRLP